MDASRRALMLALAKDQDCAPTHDHNRKAMRLMFELQALGFAVVRDPPPAGLTSLPVHTLADLGRRA